MLSSAATACQRRALFSHGTSRNQGHRTKADMLGYLKLCRDQCDLAWLWHTHMAMYHGFGPSSNDILILNAIE